MLSGANRPLSPAPDCDVETGAEGDEPPADDVMGVAGDPDDRLPGTPGCGRTELIWPEACLGETCDAIAPGAAVGGAGTRGAQRT